VYLATRNADLGFGEGSAVSGNPVAGASSIGGYRHGWRRHLKLGFGVAGVRRPVGHRRWLGTAVEPDSGGGITGDVGSRRGQREWGVAYPCLIQ
jgi:hypothetical protein